MRESFAQERRVSRGRKDRSDRNDWIGVLGSTQGRASAADLSGTRVRVPGIASNDRLRRMQIISRTKAAQRTGIEPGNHRYLDLFTVATLASDHRLERTINDQRVHRGAGTHYSCGRILAHECGKRTRRSDVKSTACTAVSPRIDGLRENSPSLGARDRRRLRPAKPEVDRQHLNVRQPVQTGANAKMSPPRTEEHNLLAAFFSRPSRSGL